MNVDIVSALIGALFGFIGSFFLLSFNYKDMYSKIVSTSRMEWINAFRDEVGTIVACLETSENVSEAEKARAKLLSRLNMDTGKCGNEHNFAFAELLNKINFSSQKKNTAIIEELISFTRKILEPEWQRVKEEAKGRKR